jgi:4-amino-4-deoxy-L-arabinose transferase-like glycosyltransferase
MNLVKNHIPILLVLLGIALVWVCRFSSLQDPYFWDEMGVYGNGVQYLLTHGISILPNAMPPEISRGHPLLFYAIHALVLKFFGNSFLISHAFALVISVACLWSTYLLAKEFGSKLMAAMAVLLLASLNIFLAQSTLVLPEMMVALLSTLALLCYFRKKYICVVITLSVGVMVKESMIISAGFLGLVYLFELIKAKTLKENIARLFLFMLPLFVLLFFLLIQKIQNGWYFFPYHTDILKEGALAGFFEKLELHYNFIFFKQGRNQWLPMVFLALVSLFFTATKRKTLIIGTYFLYSLLLFSFAFFMDRYLLFLYPILVILVIQGVSFIAHQYKYLPVGFISIFMVLALLQHKNPTFRYDASLAYEAVISVHKDAVSSLCGLQETGLTCWTNFPINMSLRNSRLGYLNAPCQNKIRLVSNPNEANYVILYSQDFNDENFTLLQGFTKNEARVNLYKRQ